MERIRINLESAVDLCCKAVTISGLDDIKIEKAGGRICAADIISEIDVPGFRRSNVDGYAMHRFDLDIDSSDSDLQLEIDGIIAAGQNQQYSLKNGQCIHVMTGSVLPQDTPAVIKQEDVMSAGENYIRLNKKLVPGENIGLPGSVIKKGERLAEQGDILYPDKIEKIASAGYAKIPVYKIPQVYVINTGSELVLPGQPLQNGQIYHSNRSFILSKIAEAGCEAAAGSPEIKDAVALIVKEIKKGLNVSDLLIISGGTADGAYDLVISALKQLHADMLFSSIEAKPGKNVTAATVGGKLIFNFPGNPHAVGILFDTLVRPVLNKIKGIKEFGNNWINIRLSRDISKILAGRSLYRADLIEKEAAFFARPLAKKENYTGIRPLIIDLQPGQGRQGDIVKGLIL